MAKQQKPAGPVRPALGPEEIWALKDPTERTLAAIAWTDYARARVAEGLELRDEGIRTMKAAGISQPEIARRTRLSLGTVKAVLR